MNSISKTIQATRLRSNHKLEIIASLLYSLGQLTLGLFLHPYRSMQLLVRGKVFIPLAFLPTLIFIVMLALTRLNFLVAFLSAFWILKILYQFLVFFCFYWQLILCYLLFRFSRVFWH